MIRSHGSPMKDCQTENPTTSSAGQTTSHNSWLFISHSKDGYKWVQWSFLGGVKPSRSSVTNPGLWRTQYIYLNLSEHIPLLLTNLLLFSCVTCSLKVTIYCSLNYDRVFCCFFLNVLISSLRKCPPLAYAFLEWNFLSSQGSTPPTAHTQPPMVPALAVSWITEVFYFPKGHLNNQWDIQI